MSLPSGISAHIVRPKELTPSEIELWASFCRQDASLTHPFLSYAFTRAVDRVYPYVYVAILEKDGHAVALFPYQFSGRFGQLIGAAERVGGHLSDRFGVIANADLGIDVSELLNFANLSSLSYSFMPIEQHRYGLRGQQVMTCQRIELSGEPSEFLAKFKATNHRFASQLDYNERRCTRELGPITFDFQHASPDQELSRIIEVKRSQYRRTKRPDNLSAAWKTQLFRELLRNPDPSCTAVVSTIHAGEKWLASHFGLMSKEVFHYWFPVYNQEFSQLSPGHMLTKHLIVAALSRGIKAFDLGGYGEYKDRYQPKIYELWAGFWYAPTIGGHFSHLVQSISWRIGRL